jgi:hypothetical protein
MAAMLSYCRQEVVLKWYSRLHHEPKQLAVPAQPALWCVATTTRSACLVRDGELKPVNGQKK